MEGFSQKDGGNCSADAGDGDEKQQRSQHASYHHQGQPLGIFELLDHRQRFWVRCAGCSLIKYLSQSALEFPATVEDGHGRTRKNGKNAKRH